MPLPLSKNQVRNLGKRLRDAPTPAPDDLDLLAEVLASYDEALHAAAQILSDLGLQTSGRLKNTGTILEKLRRDRSTNLQNIQDLAGLRVFLADTDGRREQDEIVERIASAFAARRAAPRIHDRRTRPSRGYRAVHLVIEVDGVPVEVQIRTRAQHEWAEFFERVADRWGRDIRYPDGQPDVSWLLGDSAGAARDLLEREWRTVAEQWVEQAIELADLVERIESPEERGTSRADTSELWDDLRTILAGTLAAMDELAGTVDRLESDP